MIEDGKIVLFPFPNTDQTQGKLRPALVLRQLPGRHDDWLVCMISSRWPQRIRGFDEPIAESDEDFAAASGLKVPSVIRIARLAVVERALFIGTIGRVSASRLQAVRSRLGEWISAARLEIPSPAQR